MRHGGLVVLGFLVVLAGIAFPVGLLVLPFLLAALVVVLRQGPRERTSHLALLLGASLAVGVIGVVNTGGSACVDGVQQVRPGEFGSCSIDGRPWLAAAGLGLLVVLMGTLLTRRPDRQ